MSDITTIQELKYKYPSLQIDDHGGACPYQAEGTLDDKAFYFRYRHGHARLSVDSDFDNSDRYMYPAYSASESYGHPLDGVLSTEEFVQLMDKLILNLMDKDGNRWDQERFDYEQNKVETAAKDRLTEFAEWLISLDDDDPESAARQERRTVTLTQIIERAKEALG